MKGLISLPMMTVFNLGS